MNAVEHEWRRKVLHLAGLWVPIGYWFVDRSTTIVVLCVITCGCLLIDCLRLIFQGLNRLIVRLFSSMLRGNEHHYLTGLSYYLIGMLLSVLLFDKILAILSICFLIVGDSSAGLVGTCWGRTRIRQKSLEGSFVCLVICTVMGWILLADKFELPLKITLTVTGAFTATVAEMLSSGINDNITIPLISGFAMTTVVELQ